MSVSVFQKIKDILFKDVAAENELKDLAVLLRMLCLINFAFNLAMTFISLISLRSGLFQWSLSFMVFYAFVLWMTYWGRSSVCIYVYSGVMMIAMITYSFSLGPTVGFQFSLYTLILLYCYKTDDNPMTKYFSSAVVCFVVIGIWVYLEYLDKMVAFTKGQDLALLLTNTIYLSVTFITITGFYYMKFASSEHKILKYAKKLEKLATMDPLTQLTNRRGMMEHLDRYINNASNEGMLSLALSDIDFFKRVNDTYGHDAGDYVLVELSKIFQDFMKDKGRISRWGGEEFLFSFEHSNGDYAYEQLTKLKYQIEKNTFHYKEYIFNVTMTFGLEEYDDSIGISKTIEHADNKLYQGKAEGRNRIIY